MDPARDTLMAIGLMYSVNENNRRTTILSHDGISMDLREGLLGLGGPIDFHEGCCRVRLVESFEIVFSASKLTQF